MVGRKLAGRGLLSRILLYIRHEPAVPAAASLLIALATVAWAGAATDLALYWGGVAVGHWLSVAAVAVAATAWHAALLAMGGPSVFRDCLVFAASASAPVAVYFGSLLGAFLPTLWMAMLAAALPLAALLVSFPRYGRLLECVARYVGETVPAPDSTAGRRWVATACPGGGRSLRRGESALCVVSVGLLETPGVFRRSEGGTFGFLNFKVAEGAVPSGRTRRLSASISTESTATTRRTTSRPSASAASTNSSGSWKASCSSTPATASTSSSCARATSCRPATRTRLSWTKSLR